MISQKKRAFRYSDLKSVPKRIRQALFRFCIYGALLVAGEVGFYSLTKIGRSIPLVSFLFQYDWEVDPALALHHIWDVPIQTFFGQASLYMFFVYGAICVFGLEPAYRFMKRKDVPVILRGLVYMSIVLFMECTLGWILKFLTGYDIWIYYGPGTLFTYTSLAIAPMWFICGLVSENVIAVFDSFDQIKMDMYGLNDLDDAGTGRKRNKIVILSDVHIGPKGENGNPAGWFYGMYEIYFSILLYKISRDRRVRELVFLGDLFDTWLYPVEQKPDSIDTIIKNWQNSLFVQPLLRCIKNIPDVYCIPGNHDMQLKTDDVSSLSVDGKTMQVISSAAYNKKKHLEGKTVLSLEHGNEADFFNASDDEIDSVQGIPVGYFVSRLVTDAEDFDVDAVFTETYARILSSNFTDSDTDTAENRAGRLFIKLFFDALVVFANRKRPDNARLDDHSVIRMPEGYTDVTIADVKSKYSSLLSAWLSNHKTYFFAAAGKEGLDRYAQEKFGKKNWKLWFTRLFSPQNAEKIVVMGHTHFSKIEYIMDREISGVYANTGCLCKNSKQTGARWVEITDSKKGATVKLRRL